MNKTRILVIDDDIPVCRSICMALASDRYIVDTAFSGEEGMALDKENPYDVFIVDLMMPGMTGLQFLEEIKEKRSQTRVVLITGYPTVETAVKSVKLGAVDYLSKPFTPAELRQVIEKKSI